MRCSAQMAAADINPDAHRVLLVGPRIVHLRAAFEKRGYPVVAAPKGVEGMAHLDTDPCDLVVLELNLGDLTATEFLMAARQGHPRSVFILVDEAARAGQIVKALQAGLDGYLATPPDEDRLFYEVDRHLFRLGSSDVSGFEENSTQTTMTTMAEVDVSRGIEARDLAEQLERARETIETLQRDAMRFEADALTLGAVQEALGGHLETKLDATEAMRLRERLGLAQVAEIELVTLRGDVQTLKAQKREGDAHVEELLRELRQAKAALLDVEEAKVTAEHLPSHHAADPEKLKELEDERARWERRAHELETTLSAAKKALAVAEEEIETAAFEAKAAAKDDIDAARAERNELQEQLSLLSAEIERLGKVAAAADAARAEKDVEIERLRADLAKAEAMAQGLSVKSAEDEIRGAAEVEGRIDEALSALRVELEATHEAAIAAAVAAERARLEREQTSALEVAMSAASADADERHRKALAAAVAAERDAGAAAKAAAEDAARAAAAEDAARLRDEAVAAASAAIRAELEATIEALRQEAQVARERADDVELQLEEARTKTEFLELDAARVNSDAEARVAAAEAEFKREKLRLVEEKQAAASGSQEAVLKLDGYRKEAAAAKRELDEAKAQTEQLQKRIDHLAEAHATLERECRSARDDRDREAERAKAALDGLERLEASLSLQQGHASRLETELKAAEVAVDAERARADAAEEAVRQLQRAADDAAEQAAKAIDDADQQRRDLAAAKDAELRAAQETLARLQAQLTATEEKLQQADDERLEVKARAAVDAEDRQREAASFEERLAAARGESADTIEGLKSELRQLEERAAAAEASVAALGAERVSATAERDAAAAAAAAAAAELEALRAGSASGDTTADGDERIALKAALSVMETELAAVKASVDEARIAHEAELAAHKEHSAAHLAATVDAANVEISRMRTEAQAVHAAASQAVADLQQRLADAEAALAARGQNGVEGPHANHSDNGHDGAAKQLATRIAELEAQLAQVDPAVMSTVRSLVEAVDPLRWGLGAAIDYLDPFEGNDANLATHVRNLRLLQATLARLVAESGKA